MMERVPTLEKDKWLAVTAGLGSSDFEGAALRIKKTLDSVGVVDKSVAVLTKDLIEVCPETSRIYSNFLNKETRGYGFMCWKAEIVSAALNGYWGDFNGVIWIDAGCEITLNPITKIILRKFQLFARRNGIACFTLDTEEVAYTKRDLFEKFPDIDPYAAGPQIQTTWMMFHGVTGKLVADEWLNIVCSGVHLLDFEPSRHEEFPEFIENRNDQSAFSLVCKENQIPIMRYRPTSGIGSRISSIRGMFNPIWTSRNRKSDSIKRSYHKFFES